jgi:phasin
MAKDPSFEPLKILSEMRTLGEQSVTQARKAFDSSIQAANRAVGQLEGQTWAVHSGAAEIAQKSVEYAERNVAATFDFAENLMRAKDVAEVMGLQSQYLNRQMRALSAQVQELGQSAAKMLVEAAKPKS